VTIGPEVTIGAAEITTAHSRTWRPTAAHVRAALLSVVAIGLAVLFRVPDLLVLAMPLAVIAVWSTVRRPGDDPELTGRLGPSTIREGDATTWTGAISTVDGLEEVAAVVPRRRWMSTQPASGVTAVSVARSHAHQEPLSLAVELRSTHWGRRRVGPVMTSATSAFGAFRWLATDYEHRLMTLPRPPAFDAMPPTHRAAGLVGLTRSNRAGEGAEFAGIRPFQPGDRLRRINWPRSLRTGELHVAATWADQDSHVALLLDALDDFGPSEGIDGAESSLDIAVRAAAAVAEHFLRRGDRVSLRVFGSTGVPRIPAASGTSHLRRILDALARIEPGTDPADLVKTRREPLAAGALAIMLSPLASPKALERAAAMSAHGLNVAVIDTLPPDFVRVGDAIAALAWRIRLLERRQELDAIREVGVPVVAWRGSGTLDPFLREIARRAVAPRLARR
jgi:uncharacterized protein (DUF58 family)